MSSSPSPDSAPSPTSSSPPSPPAPPTAPSPAPPTAPSPAPPTAPPPAPPAAPPPSNSTAPPPQPASSPPPPATETPPSSSSPPPPPPSSTPPSSAPPGNPSPVSLPPPRGSSSSNIPPASRGSPPSSPSPSSNSVSTPLVLGLAVGGVVILLLLGLTCFCCFRKKRRLRPLPPSPPPRGSSSSNRPPASRGSPPSSPSPSSNSVSTPLVLGLSVGGVVILLLLGLTCFCCFRKKRRPRPLPPSPPPHHHYGAPPPLPVKDQPYGQQNWYNAPPPVDQVAKIPPNPPVLFAPRPHPPGKFGAPPPPPPPAMISSGASGSSYSGSENLTHPLSPGIALGFSKSAFTYEELVMATDGFSDANLLGQGGFGYVHRGMLPNGKEVAVKQLKAGSGQGEREFQAEVEIISRVHHRHLVSLVGYCIADGKRLLVYEFVPNNTLEFHLHGSGRPTLDWPTRLKIALGAAKGLSYLHEDCHPKIIHRDIKASNILLDFKFEAKVADFGLAKIASETNTHVSTRVMGTFGYLAPEYASSGKLTDKSDVFSFGVMLLELITGRRPVDSNQAFMDDSLVDWARPLLMRAMDDGNLDAVCDPRLKNAYNSTEMRRMIACAAASVRHSAKRRPRMSQIVRALEGDVSLEDLNVVKPGHSGVYSSHGSSDYDTMQYNEDMKKFRKMALGSQGYGSSAYDAPTTESARIPSGSSSEGRGTREMEMGRVKDSKGFSSSS